MRPLLLALLLVTPALVGCPGDEAGTTDGPETPGDASVVWPAEAVPFQEGHDHTEPTQHTDRSTANFELRGYDPLVTDYHGATSGDHLCGETATEGERDLVVTHSFGTDVAFVVADVSDPDDPRKIGEMALPYSHTYDVAVTPDGNYVFLALSGADNGPDQEPSAAPDGASDQPSSLEMRWTSACGETQNETEQVPFQSGVLLVDLSNPSDPEIADYLAQPVLGPHSVFATTVDGTHRILASTTNLNHQTSYFTFLTVEETPLGPRLLETGQYSAQNPQPNPGQPQPPLTNGHVDGWIAPHPDTGETLAYLADWNGGLHIVRLDDMGSPERVAVWDDYDPDAGAGMTGSIHGALPASSLWDGKHYTFIGQEVVGRPAERPSGQVIMLDTTDPSDPTAIARWTLPTDVEFEGSLLFSTHYFDLVDRTLFVSTYHGGVWAVGTDPIEGTHQLPTKGVFLPNMTSPQPPPEHLSIFRWTPIVLDVLALPGGDLAVLDGTSGLYTVRFHEDVPIPEPEPWTQDGWTPPSGGDSPLPPLPTGS